MPCDQIRTTTMQWSEATDPVLVARAMQALGYEVYQATERFVAGVTQDGTRVVFRDKELEIEQQYGAAAFDPNPLKQRYSAEVLKDRWADAGWQVEEQDAQQKAVAGFTREW